MTELHEAIGSDYDEWVDHASKSSIFGIRMDTLSRTDLLAVIGELGKEMETMREWHKKDVAFLGDLHKVARR